MSKRTALLVSVVFLLSFPGCKKKQPPSRAHQKELEQLTSLLRTYGFRKGTPDTLEKLRNLAHRATGTISTEAWFKVSRGHLDWYLTALSSNDGGLMKALMAQLGLPAECCADAKSCVAGNKLKVSDGCREKLHAAIQKEFQSVAAGEEGQGGYAKLATEAQQLLQSLLIHSKKMEPAYYKNFTRLVVERDPIATRARLASIIALGEKLGLISRQPPDRAPLMLAYLAPYPCASAYRQLLRADSALAVQKLLLEARCAYTCKALSQLPKGAAALFKAVTKDCAFDELGFKRPSESAYFTQEAFVAINAANFLANIAIYIPGELKDPVMRIHRKLARQFLSQIASLRIRLPYPAAAKLNNKWVEPPALAGYAGEPLKGLVHLAMGPDATYLGVIPTLGFDPKERVTRMLDATSGFHFPGAKLPVPLTVKGPGQSLQVLLNRARSVSSALHPHTARSKWADWITLYVDKKQPAKHLDKHIANFANLQVPAVQVAFVADPAAGSAGRGIVFYLAKSPKEAVTLEDKDFAQPTQPPGSAGAGSKPPGITAFVLKKAPPLTVQAMLRTISNRLKNNPNAKVYWNP